MPATSSRSFIPNRKAHLNTKSFLVGAAAGALLLLPSQLPAAAAQLHFVVDAAPAASVNFDVKLPLRNSAELDALIHVQSSADSPMYHHFLTPAQFRASFGPTAATFARAEAVLRANGFAITRVDSQLLHVRGSAATIGRVFHSQLGVVTEVGQPSHFAARTPLVVPAGLHALGATITSLSGTMRPKPLFQRTAAAPQNRYSKVGGYWFDDLKQAYSYPTYGAANGKGVTVATVGLSDFSSADAMAYFAHEKLGSAAFPFPKVEHLLLPGASPFDPSTGIGDEADLDVQQVGGSAPGATVIGVSFGTDSEFLDTYSYLDESNIADVVSTSYGECELYYTAAYNHGIDQTDILLSYHDLFRQGNAQGITFLFSSGDNSGTQCYPVAYFGPGTGKIYNPVNHGAGIWVDDPNVTGVGGTNLITSYVKGSLKSTYVSENEIGDRITTAVDFDGTGNAIVNALWGSGGGPSSIFAKPTFQYLVPTGYGTRTVPDVAMHMGGCPFYGAGINVSCDLVNRDSFDYAVIGGELGGLIGTSASSPEFAGLLAVKESIIHSRLGNENEDIYRLAAANAKGKYFHQGIPAYNGIVRIAAGQLGYNPIVGVGTPIANNFVGLPNVSLAGNPQTPSNP
jgi:subtilase family serine protease